MRSPVRTLRLAWAVMEIQIKTIVREPAALFFLLLFPILFLILFGALLTFDLDPRTDVTFNEYFFPGIMGATIFGTSFNLFGNSLAVQQFDGTLKQLSASPLPRTSFFLGMIGGSAALTLLQLAVMWIIGFAAYGFTVPDAAGWLRLIWILLLGIPAGCVLAIAILPLIPSARSAPAVLQVPYLVLMFISGVYFFFSNLPTAVQWIAGLFPIRWLAQGLRSVFLPDDFKWVEPAQSWQLELVALVPLAWIVLGLLVGKLTFKWDRSA